MNTFWQAVLYIGITLVIYASMVFVYRKVRFPLLLPVVTCTVLLVSLLMSMKVSYDQYMLGGQWINQLLGPAVVALAYPLYRQRELLLKYGFPILASTLSGLIFGILSGTMLAILLGYEPGYFLSVLPKSITTPVAIEISRQIGGEPALTSIFVMIAGFTGAIFGPLCFKWFKLDTNLGKGISLGTSSHAIGTSVALEYGAEAVSMSSIAMTVNAVLGSLICPLMASLLT